MTSAMRAPSPLVTVARIIPLVNPREIARIHGGDLWVQAADGGGSEFCLALPSVTEAAV